MAITELSKPHRHVLEVRLRSLERLLRRIEDVLAGSPTEEWLTTYTDPLPETITGQLATLVAEAKVELRQLIDDLGLRPKRVSLSRMILAHLVLGSNNLLEAMTPGLASSGPVPGELAAYLDPRLDKLNHLLGEARRLIEATLSPPEKWTTRTVELADEESDETQERKP